MLPGSATWIQCGDALQRSSIRQIKDHRVPGCCCDIVTVATNALSPKPRTRILGRVSLSSINFFVRSDSLEAPTLL